MKSRDLAILIGGIVGAIVGAVAAWALVNTRERQSHARLGATSGLEFRGNAGDLVKIGVAILAVVRQVSDVFRPGVD